MLPSNPGESPTTEKKKALDSESNVVVDRDESRGLHTDNEKTIQRSELISFARLMSIKKEMEELVKRKRVLGLLESQKFNANTFKASPILKEIEESKQEDNIIKLNIGGQIFTTTRMTLNRRENMVKVMINSDFPIDRDEDGCIIIADRNPNYFPIILEYIRTGSTKYIGLWEEYPTDEILLHLRNLLEESDFFGTQKLSNIVALKIKQDTAILSNGKTKEKKEETKEEDFKNEDNSLLIREFARLTQTEKDQVEKYIKEKEMVLENLREEVKKIDERIEKPSKKFNVRGVTFEIGIEKLVANECLLTNLHKMVNSDEELFIDRDPSTFEILVKFFNTQQVSVIPKDMAQRKLVYKMANEFNVAAILEYLDPLRFPSELLGEHNLKIKEAEDFLRNIYSTKRSHPILMDPYLNLVEVFGEETETSKLFEKREATIPLLFDFENEKEAEELCKRSQVTKPNIPQLCDSKQTFLNQFDAFTCLLFKDLNWDNIVCAGGCVLNCMLKAHLKENTKVDTIVNPVVSYEDPNEKPYWTEDDISDEDTQDLDDNEYFTSSADEDFVELIKKDHDVVRKPLKEDSQEKKLYEHYRKNFPKSDIDIFLYDIDEKGAKEKINYLYEHFKKQLLSIPKSSYIKTDAWKSGELDDILVIRTDNAITFVFHPNFRTIQVILRLYKSPAEVITGFDIPCCCVAYDGSKIFALPRCVQAISTRTNIVDPDRQSTTYETRLVKYALRGFRIGVVGFSEKKVCNRILTDHFSIQTNFSFMKTSPKADIKQVTGLARILLIRHAIKNCERKKAALWSIGGGQTLETTEKKLAPSKGFYTDISSSFSYNTPRRSHIILSNKAFGIKNFGNRAPSFQHSLNDIKSITEPNTKKKKKHPFQSLKFITINPGSQGVGSFYPHQKNFFRDAYVSPSRLKKTKNIYYWRDKSKDIYFENSSAIEKQYRCFIRTRKETDSKFILSNVQYIDFRNFCIMDTTTKKNVSYVYRIKGKGKVVKRSKIIPQIDHQAVLFGEEDVENTENKEESYTVPFTSHRYAQRESCNKCKHSHWNQIHNHAPNTTSTVLDSEEDIEEDNDDDYYDYEEDESEDEDDEASEEAFQRMMMMNAMLMQQGKGPGCPQQ